MVLHGLNYCPSCWPYWGWAWDWAQGLWSMNGEPFFRAPLYPFALSLLYRVFGHDLTAVRILSSRRSTPRIRPMPSMGRPTWANTIYSMIRPTPGTPAVPIDASTDIRITVR